MVPYEFGSLTIAKFKKLGIPELPQDDDSVAGLTFRSYEDMGHSANQEELADFLKWTLKVVPN